jgi:hypothetical protein
LEKMLTRKETAQFFRLALRLQLVDVGAVDRWVDSVITADAVVGDPFTELAGASQLRPETLDQLLGRVTGPGDDSLSGRMLLALLYRRVRQAALTPEFAIKLALQAGRSGALSETETYKADQLDDSVWLATNDTYGTLDDVRRDIEAFLGKYADLDKQIPAA